MATFQEKLEHACRVFSVTLDDVCKATKISPFAMELHANGQRNLSHNAMVLLCQYFDLRGDYFTNDNIRYVAEETLPTKVRELLSESDDKRGIMCYQVVNNNDPDVTPEQLEKFLEFIEDKKNQ